jgi:hypothetical protein
VLLIYGHITHKLSVEEFFLRRKEVDESQPECDSNTPVDEGNFG